VAGGWSPELGRVWSRKATGDVLAAIARQPKLTIYIGTDGDNDVGTFSRGEVYSRTIHRKLRNVDHGSAVGSSALEHLEALVPGIHLGEHCGIDMQEDGYSLASNRCSDWNHALADLLEELPTGQKSEQFHAEIWLHNDAMVNGPSPVRLAPLFVLLRRGTQEYCASKRRSPGGWRVCASRQSVTST
jgi:hypothetical protein